MIFGFRARRAACGGLSAVAAAAALLLAPATAVAATVSVDNGVLTMTAAPGGRTSFGASYMPWASTYTVTGGREVRNGPFVNSQLTAVGPGCAFRVIPGAPPNQIADCAAASVIFARVTLADDGGIASLFNFDVPAVLLGAAGDDALTSGLGDGATQMHGGGGDDALMSFSPAADLLDGGDGDDRLLIRGRGLTGPVGPDTLIGGPGDDLFRAQRGVTGLRFDCGSGQDAVRAPAPGVAIGHALTADCPPVVTATPAAGVLAGKRLIVRMRVSEPVSGTVALNTGGRAPIDSGSGTTARAVIRLNARKLRALRSPRRLRPVARIKLVDRSGETGAAAVRVRIRR